VIKADELLSASVEFQYSIMPARTVRKRDICVTAGCEGERYRAPGGKLDSYCVRCRRENAKRYAAAKRKRAGLG